MRKRQTQRIDPEAIVGRTARTAGMFEGEPRKEEGFKTMPFIMKDGKIYKNETNKE